ncbi:hypothetical protein PJ233_21000, partial [Escherichia coli]|nr:hypothetical protein [Escherichia coli]
MTLDYSYPNHLLEIVVNGYYDDVNKNESAIPYIGNYDILLNDAKAGKIDRIYIAMSMDDHEKIKN